MAKHWSGTMAASNYAAHGGTKQGAGMLSFGMGPGSAAKKTKIDSKDIGYSDAAKSKGPKGKPYNQE